MATFDTLAAVTDIRVSSSLFYMLGGFAPDDEVGLYFENAGVGANDGSLLATVTANADGNGVFEVTSALTGTWVIWAHAPFAGAAKADRILSAVTVTWTSDAGDVPEYITPPVLSISAVGSGQVTLDWSAAVPIDARVEGDLEYDTFESGTSSPPSGTVGTLTPIFPTAGLTTVNSGLTGGTLYYFQISTVGAEVLLGSGAFAFMRDYSNIVSATPEAPAVLTVSLSGVRVPRN